MSLISDSIFAYKVDSWELPHLKFDYLPLIAVFKNNEIHSIWKKTPVKLNIICTPGSIQIFSSDDPAGNIPDLKDHLTFFSRTKRRLMMPSEGLGKTVGASDTIG